MDIDMAKTRELTIVFDDEDIEHLKDFLTEFDNLRLAQNSLRETSRMAPTIWHQLWDATNQ